MQTTTQCILVVDDSAIIREPIEVVLRERGYRVITACNGVEALAEIAQHRPDLVLLDLDMPVMDGLTALRRLRADPLTSPTKIIILSAEADRARIIEAARLGISAYVLKTGFSLKALQERVQAVLGSTPPVPPSAQECAEALPRTKRTGPAVRADDPSTARRETTTPVREPAAPLLNRTDLDARVLERFELGGFSPTVKRVLDLTSTDSYSIDDVAAAAAQDQAIAVKVLRLANSTAFNRGDRVDSVHKAVMRVGIQNFRQVVLTVGVVDAVHMGQQAMPLNYGRFWEHSIATGVIASSLARELHHKDADTAFTAGLLHDLGRMILAGAFPEQYAQVLAHARAHKVPMEESEQQLLRTNHAEVLGRMLTSWHFPKELIAPIQHHHAEATDIKHLAPQQVGAVLRLGLANRLAHALAIGSSGNDVIYSTDAHCRLLGVDGAALDRIASQCKQQTDEIRTVLLSSAPSMDPSHLTSSAGDRGSVHHAVIFASGLPETDAFRLFVDNVLNARATRPPQLAIVHVTAATERDAARACLKNALAQAGSPSLPVLILSPKARYTHQHLGIPTSGTCIATPTPVDDLVRLAQQYGERSEHRDAA
ncbi:MAG TPA: response regulator [Phycisphaerales bacterium]|nr:response regulator [Phycisphaerales bacterium]